MKVNIGWVLERSATPFVIGAFLLSVFFLVWRLSVAPIAILLGLGIIAGVALVTFLVGLIRAKGMFETRADSIVRLETALGLSAALSSADAEKTSWPEPISSIKLPLRWEYKRVILPMVGFVILSSCALLIPVPAKEASVPTSAPRSWQNLNQKLNELKEEELVDQEYVEEMEKKLEQLQSQSQEDWYSHSSLEAGEALASQHQKEVGNMAKSLEKGAEALEALTSPEAEQMSQKQKEKLQQQLNDAAEQLQKGGLKPNKELLEKMEQMGKDITEGMSKEEIENLKQQMKELSEQMKKQNGESGENNGEEGQQPGEGDGDGEGEGRNDSNKRKKPQDKDYESSNEEDGPTNRDLGELAEDYNGKNAVPLKSQDLSKALPGELFDVSEGEHEVDLSATSQRSGGDTQNTGRGGAATFKGNYLPEEKRALKKFFK